MIISLDKAVTGQQYKINKIDDHNSEVRRQLSVRGFVRGVVIKVLRAQGSGPLLIEIKHSRIAIGRSEAAMIFVSLHTVV